MHRLSEFGELDEDELGLLFHIAGWCLKRVRDERPDLKDMIENFGTDRRDDVTGKFLFHANTQFVEFYHALSSEVFNRLNFENFNKDPGTLPLRVESEVQDCERLQNALRKLIPERYRQHTHAVFNLSIHFTVKSAVNDFLKKYNLVPNKRSQALRTTLACGSAPIPTPVRKKNRSKAKCIQGCESKCTDMVMCDKCQHWFHYDCVGITGDGPSEEDEWLCEFCPGE